jgi:hypothetical protein
LTRLFRNSELPVGIVSPSPKRPIPLEGDALEASPYYLLDVVQDELRVSLVARIEYSKGARA